MVMYLKRPGGHSQYSVPLASQARAHSPIIRGRRWILNNLEQQLNLTALASKAGMSPRNFSRVFQSETGLRPAAYAEQVHTEKARRLLEETSMPLDHVAQQSGLGKAASARRISLRRLAISLRLYRGQFKLGAKGLTG
ncbi:helix-turn-helix domain-containing protein [Methylobacterium phyllosphaerae]